MKAPKPCGSPISLRRRQYWVRQFAAYRHAVDMAAIDAWLTQFDGPHRDLGARVLDGVEFFDAQRVGAFFRNGLNALPGWHCNLAQRQGKWRFCSWGTSPGESGDSMLHSFRLANGLSHRSHNGLFIYPSGILTAGLGADDSLVFVDDFIGTGQQVCDAWDEFFAELTAGIGNVYLLVAVACQKGRLRVSSDTEVQVVPGQELLEDENLFGPRCVHFSSQEKDTLLAYSKRADKRAPKGYGEMGLLVVFQHRCPNNSIALLHARSNRWAPLFPRFD